MHKIWPGRRAHYINYENRNNSDLDGMSLASFCQNRAAVVMNQEQVFRLEVSVVIDIIKKTFIFTNWKQNIKSSIHSYMYVPVLKSSSNLL